MFRVLVSVSREGITGLFIFFICCVGFYTGVVREWRFEFVFRGVDL